MDLTDLLSELTKPMLPTKALVISFLVFLSLCIVAIVAEKTKLHKCCWRMCGTIHRDGCCNGGHHRFTTEQTETRL